MSPRPTEQQWIVSDVVGTVAGIAAGHLWSADTFGTVAQQLMRPASTGGASTTPGMA